MPVIDGVGLDESGICLGIPSLGVNAVEDAGKFALDALKDGF